MCAAATDVTSCAMLSVCSSNFPSFLSAWLASLRGDGVVTTDEEDATPVDAAGC